MTLARMFFIVLASVVYGILVRLTNSILPGIVLHATGDAIGIVWIWWLGRRPGADGERGFAAASADPWFWANCLIAVALGIAAVWAFRRLAAASAAAADGAGSAGGPKPGDIQSEGQTGRAMERCSDPPNDHERDLVALETLEKASKLDHLCAPNRLAGCTKLVDERLHPLEGQETLLVRLAQILANQRPIDVDLIALDDRIRARVELRQFRGGHTRILNTISHAGVDKGTCRVETGRAAIELTLGTGQSRSVAQA